MTDDAEYEVVVTDARAWRWDCGGQITKAVPEYAVWCATCSGLESYQPHKSLKAAEKNFRKLGWKKTHRCGWICPNCVTWNRF